MKIFKKQIPKTILYNLLDKVKISENNQYIIDKPIFKKLLPYILVFLEECKDYYFNSQKKYVTKTPFSYKAFLTVVRQICNNNDIPFFYRLKFLHSKYEIIYYINFENSD
uniref:Uncharacterized protein n=1 Tax=viral metagenome TaxID=1070528 RepID=A0A6C0HRL0_9ZZZZ